MQGIIFAALKSFIENNIGVGAWPKYLASAGIGRADYEYSETYDDSELVSLVLIASQDLSLPVQDLLRSFGCYLAPGLLQVYKVLVQSDWRTLDLIENVEETIHKVVRARKPQAKPPEIRCHRHSSHSIEITYASQRKLCSVLKGVVEGVAAHFNETVTVHEVSCMLDGAEHCKVIVSKDADGTVIDGKHANADLSATVRFTAPEAGSFKKFGRYEIVGELGRGAMGVVYRALDNNLGREVALKILLSERTATVEETSRFKQEARAAARLKHRAIVAVYDIGEDKGLPFYVMELIQGKTIDEWVIKNPGFHKILGVVKELSSALHCAHQAGIIHRDVKPGNFIIDAQGQGYLMDFGVARDAAADSNLTQLGQLIGTPHYMSPEQFEGIPGLLGPHTDVYAVGCLLYYALCGRPPFVGPTMTAIVKRVLLEAADLPSSLNPEVPNVLDDLIMRCLEKDSEKRYSSAKELEDAIGEVMSSH